MSGSAGVFRSHPLYFSVPFSICCGCQYSAPVYLRCLGSARLNRCVYGARPGRPLISPKRRRKDTRQYDRQGSHNSRSVANSPIRAPLVLEFPTPVPAREAKDIARRRWASRVQGALITRLIGRALSLTMRIESGNSGRRPPGGPYIPRAHLRAVFFARSSRYYRDYRKW